MFKSKVDMSRSSGDILKNNFNANMNNDLSHKIEMENFVQNHQMQTEINELRALDEKLSLNFNNNSTSKLNH